MRHGSGGPLGRHLTTLDVVIVTEERAADKFFLEGV
jgi:hypothetical protein